MFMWWFALLANILGVVLNITVGFLKEWTPARYFFATISAIIVIYMLVTRKKTWLQILKEQGKI